VLFKIVENMKVPSKWQHKVKNTRKLIQYSQTGKQKNGLHSCFVCEVDLPPKVVELIYLVIDPPKNLANLAAWIWYNATQYILMSIYVPFKWRNKNQGGTQKIPLLLIPFRAGLRKDTVPIYFEGSSKQK
jgi:hypothetical protein